MVFIKLVFVTVSNLNYKMVKNSLFVTVRNLKYKMCNKNGLTVTVANLNCSAVRLKADSFLTKPKLRSDCWPFRGELSCVLATALPALNAFSKK
jgi:hypothetical protein